ncbi:O-antigen polymerase [Flavobacterium hungaricum]|uniref:Uncharacterized protein n=1 Tax=Flavobacterium hungaricum TaxID=2082725 RepID=A0ABR9TR53_9FLAO|nr:O-antigen polymerase [Flavobacterium hungaricum]MBE8727761.1 hypothetical protein [Flavobacterium hungaricum]
MLNNPVKFVLLNFFSYLIILLFGGFSLAFPISVFFSLLIIASSYKEFGIKGGLIFATIYLLAFDSEIFYFSDYNIRIWYFYLIIIYLISFFEFLLNFRIVFKRKFIVEYIIGFVLFLWSIYFLLIEDFVSKINNIKYWVFYIGLILILNHFFRKNIKKYNFILDYIISITVFIMFWGIFQFFTNLLFISNFQLDYFNIRPSAFFSETTWYSEFIFFGMVLIFLKILTVPNMLKLLYLVPFYLLGFLFSVTRNTYLAFIIYLFFTFTFTFFIERKIFLRIVSSRFILTFIFLLVLIFIMLIPILTDIASFFVLKFSGQDDSAQGRIEAYHISVNNILKGGVFGNGYYWDKSHSTESGSALGSKSFNVFLMMGSIFGPFGGLLFFILISFYLMKSLYYYGLYKSLYIKYSFIVFFIFIQMAMFAPIHQFPFGMLIVSLSVFLFNIGVFNYEKNNICNASV